MLSDILDRNQGTFVVENLHKTFKVLLSPSSSVLRCTNGWYQESGIKTDTPTAPNYLGQKLKTEIVHNSVRKVKRRGLVPLLVLSSTLSSSSPKLSSSLVLLSSKLSRRRSE